MDSFTCLRDFSSGVEDDEDSEDSEEEPEVDFTSRYEEQNRAFMDKIWTY